MAKKKAPQTREEILDEAIGEIRSKFGEGAIMRLGDAARANVSVIPSGVLPLDVALGIGGYPRGRIIEIFGPEGSGKTTVALYGIAEAQKAGGVAAFIDAEHALDPRLAATLGVKVEDLYLSQPDSGEQALFVLDSLVRSGAVDLVVVDSPDALFVTRRGASQEVRAVVKELKGRGRREVSQISESSRPWGSYRVLHEDERHRVKRSVVMPGRSVPLQTHRHSTERWIVLRGTARATLDGTESFLCEGMELFIPRNVPHGLENCGCIDLELIVVQDGEYLGPDDA